jgi:hypothetical protein
MTFPSLNRWAGFAGIGLSLVALGTIAVGLSLSGRPDAEMCQPDEGTLAHIFQMSLVAFVPAIGVFLVTADWNTPRRALGPAAIAAAALVLAFGGLYYGEHHCGDRPRALTQATRSRPPETAGWLLTHARHGDSVPTRMPMRGPHAMSRTSMPLSSM